MSNWNDQAESAAARKYGERLYWFYAFRNSAALKLLALAAVLGVLGFTVGPRVISAALVWLDAHATVLAFVATSAVLLALTRLGRRPRRRGRP